MSNESHEELSLKSDPPLSSIPSESRPPEPSLTSDHLPDRGWYYAVSGDRFGPIPIDKLRNFLRDGALPPETHVYCVSFGAWRPAYAVKPLWRPPASDMPEQTWYVNRDGKASEGYTTKQIWDMIEEGRIREETQVYSSSLGEWKLASEVIVFASAWQLPQKPPPLPSQSPDVPSATQAENGSNTDQYELCEHLLTEAETHIEEWDCGKARRVITEADNLAVSDQDEDVRQHIDRLTQRVSEREKELEQKREEAEKLLDEARHQLEENDTLPVFETILMLREMPILEQSPDLAAEVDSLQEEAEQTERELVAQREDAAEALEVASECITNWQLEQARMYLDAAEGSPGCKLHDDLSERLSELQNNYQTASEKFEKARTTAEEQLAEAEECLHELDVQEAHQILDALQNNTAIQVDRTLGSRHNELQSQLHTTEDQLESERENLPELLDQAHKQTTGWNLESAHSLLQEVSDSLLIKTDSELKKRHQAALERLEETETKVKDQRATARKKLANAERQCAIYNCEEATELLQEVENLEAAEKDATISKRLKSIRKRIDDKTNEAQKQRSEVRRTLDAIHKSIDNWDIEEAKAFFDDLEQTDLNRIDQEIRRDIREARSKLKKVRQKAEQQSQKAQKLLEKADTKTKQKRFESAQETLERLANLEITQRRPEWENRIEKKQQHIASAREQWEQLHERADGLLNKAHSMIKESDLSAARNALKQVSELGIAEQTQSIQSRLNHLHERLQQKQNIQARSLLKKADNMLEKDLDEAARTLRAAAELNVCQSDDGLKAEYARIWEQLSARRKHEQQLQENLRTLEKHIEQNKIKSARKLFNKLIQTEDVQQDTTLYKRLKKQKQRILAKMQSIKKSRSRKANRKKAQGQAEDSGTTDFASEAALDEQDWYYYADGERKGPISMDQLQKLARNQTLQPEDHVWAQCTQDWVQARTVVDLAECFNQ